MTDLQTKGFVVIRGFLTDEILEGARADFSARPLDKSNKNYGISMASAEANALLRPIVDDVLRRVREQTGLKPDLPAGAAYFATGRGINFAWHQDHESYFTIQNHYDYLNFYIPIVKPRKDKSNLCIVPFDAFEREAPKTFRRVLRGGAARFIPMGRRTLVYFDDSGSVHLMNRNIEDLGHTPHLDAGDLLLIRGDMVHRTQDTETQRVAMSFRASMAGAAVSRSRLIDGGLYKARMMAKNAAWYRRMFAAFEEAGSDQMAAAELAEAAVRVPEPPDERRFIYELLERKLRGGVLGRFVLRSASEAATAKAEEIYHRLRARKARAAARAAARSAAMVLVWAAAGTVVFGALAGPAAAAQTFAAEVGMLSYAVRADRTPAFEQAVQQVVRGLRQLRSRQDGEPGVSMRILRGGETGENAVLYVLVADPVVPGVDYSLPHLAARGFEGAELDELQRQIAWALEGATVSSTDLRQLAAVSPLDRLRERIELDLSAAPPAAATPEGDRAVLDALRAPAWAADRLDYEISRRGGSTWEITWHLDLRNVSLLRPLNAGVVVELLDASGAVLGSSRRTFVAIDAQDGRTFSGAVDLSPQAAGRVASARLRVDPQ